MTLKKQQPVKKKRNITGYEIRRVAGVQRAYSTASYLLTSM
jgi:hypothetical protein